MSPKLKPLLLPQLVEERRKRESMPDFDMDLSSSLCTPNSSASDIPSPVTPTFSARGHLRYPSSSSSVESSHNGATVESPSSPTFTSTKSTKHSLPDVQEEPLERDNDFEMFEEDAHSQLYDCLCDDPQCLHRDPNASQSSIQLSARPDFDYDLTDGFVSDGELSSSQRYKKRKGDESPLSELATRFSTRFPSFSRKWKLRSGINSIFAPSEMQREGVTSRLASSRSSSISNSGRHVSVHGYEPQMPPTPTKSVSNSREDVSGANALDIGKVNSPSNEIEEPFATTPLLPPLMMDASANSQNVSVQSPLQSPSVAGPIDCLSGNTSPIDAIITPQLPGMPSPPLSTKPSISSFTRPGHLIPSSEIPTIVIADPNDEWANKLGHANFIIHPEPYLPETFDLEACRQLRANWDLARCNYTKHLVRTGEHYGATSKTYKLTEEKWASLDAQWRKNNDITINNTVDNGSDAFATLKYNQLSDNGNNNVMTKIPSLNDPRSGNKFPQLGDEDIVGPMVQAAAQLQRTPSRKARVFQFFVEKFSGTFAARN